ncbi:MAG: ATP-grasp domain-containing protein [Myxococcota bacterium]
MPDKHPHESYVALFGWSLRAIEAIARMDRPYVVVAPPWAEDYARNNDIPYIPWDFERVNERAGDLYERLAAEGVELAVPLFEETVEWAGAVNARLRNNPRLFNQALLFRDKAMMKRRAQMMGIPVGVFEVADDREDVKRFLIRVNEALLTLDGDPSSPIHLKQFTLAGCAGHRMISSIEEVDSIREDEFPCLLESHLDGWEFACEVFIHDRKIRFLNISEYVHLGYSVFIPASPQLEEWRPVVRKAVEELIEAFDINYGLIHPEYFLTQDGRLHFGEVAYRVPGGNAYELMERAYGFSAYQGHVLCSDPKTPEEVVEAFFPKEVVDARGYAGCFLVYPRKRIVTSAEVPDVVQNDPYYDRADLFEPPSSKVSERTAFGNHWGSVYFFGDDPDRMREVLLEQEELDYYL